MNKNLTSSELEAATSKGFCYYCVDSGDESLSKNLATHYFRDRFGLLFGLCDGDTAMLLADESLTSEDKIIFSREGITHSNGESI